MQNLATWTFRVNVPYRGFSQEWHWSLTSHRSSTRCPQHSDLPLSGKRGDLVLEIFGWVTIQSVMLQAIPSFTELFSLYYSLSIVDEDVFISIKHQDSLQERILLSASWETSQWSRSSNENLDNPNHSRWCNSRRWESRFESWSCSWAQLESLTTLQRAHWGT